MQTVLAFYIWSNPVTFGAALGVILVLAGSLLYSYVRNKEMDKKAEVNTPKLPSDEELEPLTGKNKVSI